MLSRLLPPSFDPLKLAGFALCVWAGFLLSCSQTPITVNLHAMQSSGKVSFVCRGADNAPTGHKLDECPEYESATRHTLALVTQTATNEVAVVDLYAQSIVDIDRTTPGYSFLRVGGAPGAIVTTPGGAATFVGVSGLQTNGIFALPTTCVLPPTAGEEARDLTTWPACHLSSAPGDITVVLDPVTDPALGPDTPRLACPGVTVTSSPAKDTCLADVTHEPGPAGRRKLLVALPDEHKLVLLDAQRLLDQPAGAFPECQAEATYTLEGDVPAHDLAPILPADLTPSAGANACQMTTYPVQKVSDPPTPGGFAATADRVYVADRSKPVVHVLDVSDPCAPAELPPLLPRSYLDPKRVVTTSRVAVSPVSPKGKQFVYAIDQDDQPTASVMVFDLTRIDPKDDNSRTPLLFEQSPRQPLTEPDRLSFNAPVRDVSFVMRDFPKPDPETGAGEFGLSCNPDPNASGPDTLYRPNADYSDGARPINLRGLFGFAMLTNGQVAVIDVEDFDKDCRRPVTTNAGDYEDLHGCRQDPISTPYQLSNGTRTVTDESSCNIIEEHRPRSSPLSISSTANGLHAPSLRTFPQFSTPDSALAIEKQPHVMATDFANPAEQGGTLPAQVNVNSQLYAHCEGHEDVYPCTLSSGLRQELSLDPVGQSVQNSLTLPMIEPRSYAQDETLSLVFEGQLFPARTSGFLAFEPDAAQGVLRDPDANFCGAGVEDSETISERGKALGVPAANLEEWSTAHADYVQITGDYLPSDDPYWSLGRGNQCARLINPDKPTADNRDACARKFGNIDDLSHLYAERNLSILEASSAQLVITPRACGDDSCEERVKQIACCFPTGTAYTVRAAHQWLLTGTSGLHDLVAERPGGRCVHSATCDRRKQYFGQRAFEVCDASQDATCVRTNPTAGCIGTSGTPSNGVGAIPVLPGNPASACIFENLTSRFVVYRGSQPSVPGMAFSWQTTGGFIPQSMSLLSQSSTVSPQSLGYLPELDYLAVVDASTLGLVLFDLNSLGVVSPSPYF